MSMLYVYISVAGRPALPAGLCPTQRRRVIRVWEEWRAAVSDICVGIRDKDATQHPYNCWGVFIGNNVGSIAVVSYGGCTVTPFDLLLSSSSLVWLCTTLLDSFRNTGELQQVTFILSTVISCQNLNFRILFYTLIIKWPVRPLRGKFLNVNSAIFVFRTKSLASVK
jgi:hypothetical protein